MLNIIDDTEFQNERSEKRMNIRIQETAKEIIKIAADICGTSASNFVSHAAYKEAKETIERYQNTKLHKVDHEEFFNRLNSDPAPTEYLVNAFNEYKESIM